MGGRIPSTLSPHLLRAARRRWLSAPTVIPTAKRDLNFSASPRALRLCRKIEAVFLPKAYGVPAVPWNAVLPDDSWPPPAWHGPWVDTPPIRLRRRPLVGVGRLGEGLCS